MRFRIVHALWGCLVAICGCNAYSGPLDQLCEVTVETEGIEHIEGACLRVLAVASPAGMLGLTPYSGTFDVDGKCVVDLPHGRYCFEVLECRSASPLVALKSQLLLVRGNQTVALRSLPRQKVSLDLQGFGSVAIEEFAIRSGAATGEQVWHPSRPGVVPEVIATPGQSYQVRLLGGDGPVHTAIWAKLRAPDWDVKMQQRELSVGKFVIHEDGPEIVKAGATFAFPNSKIEIEGITDETRFVTNRKFFSYAYWFDTGQSRRVTVHPQLGSSKRRQTYFIGGKYTPIAWANVMKALDKEGNQTRLSWGADLVDSSGHIVDTQKSSIEWKTVGRTPEGEIANDIVIPEDQRKQLPELRDILRVDVSYSLGKDPTKTTLVPVEFQVYSTPGFKTSAPPHWQLQAANYIARARRVYGCIEEVESKPGRHTTTIRWHNGKQAKALALVGGKNAWILMPFRQLRTGFDHYAIPWALPHEMLHNFGYHHGEKMSAATKAVNNKLGLFRWYMVDHPDLSPDDAFDGFRRFQRSAPWDVQ